MSWMESSYLPHLALGTAALEITLAVAAWRAAGRREILRPTAVLLACLAGYQLLEPLACAFPERTLLARLAFADVVWLPPLGLWLAVVLAAPARPFLRSAVQATFGVAGVLAVWVLLDPRAVSGTVCRAVIASYSNPSPLYLAYGAFYQLGMAGILVGANLLLVQTTDPLRRAHLADLQLGVLGFVVPALLTQVLVPGLVGSMPSVMCHWALVLALFLLRLVLRERAAHRVASPSFTPAHRAGAGFQS